MGRLQGSVSISLGPIVFLANYLGEGLQLPFYSSILNFLSRKLTKKISWIILLYYYISGYSREISLTFQKKAK
jgi:hypothetical protein